jgi:DNA-binding NarL/FixJ family response regulator
MRRVLLVDDHQIVRDGLKTLLREQAITVFGEASTAADALSLAREAEWDLAVVDISLGGRGGLDVVREIKQIRPKYLCSYSVCIRRNSTPGAPTRRARRDT